MHDDNGAPTPLPETGAVPERAIILPIIKRAESPIGSALDLPESDVPIIEPFTGELFVGYVLDLPASFQYVSSRTCEKLGLDVGDLRSVAVHNLTLRRPKPEIKQSPRGIEFTLDGDLEASLLLVDWIWDQIDQQIPGDLIAAVPARNVLMVTGRDVDEGTNILLSGIRRVWETTDERLLLTRSLLIRRHGAWEAADHAPERSEEGH